ncbi:Glycosyltransferase family 4 protein OS=Streptomyces cyaneofuscatus OX=66883 GN=G3I52_34630 PE=4 SV=1 [Streptomyces cyaneofuscatus]
MRPPGPLPPRAEALARTVARLLGDPERCARLAEAGREQAASWPTEDDTIAHVLSVYDELAQPLPSRT